MHKPASYSTNISTNHTGEHFFLGLHGRCKTIRVWNPLRCMIVGRNNAQDAPWLWPGVAVKPDDNEKDVDLRRPAETRGVRARLSPSRTRSGERPLIIALSISNIGGVAVSTLCRLTSMRNSLTPIKRWRHHGNLEVKRLVSDTMTLGQSLVLSQHIGRAILPELSLFVAVKIPLAASPGTRLSPPHPSLTQRPLSVMPTLVSQSRWRGAAGSRLCCVVLVYEFTTVAPVQ